MKNEAVHYSQLNEEDWNDAIRYGVSLWVENQVSRLLQKRYEKDFTTILKENHHPLSAELTGIRRKAAEWKEDIRKRYVPEKYQQDYYVFTICYANGVLTVWQLHPGVQLDIPALDVRVLTELLDEIQKSDFEASFALDDICFMLSRGKTNYLTELWRETEEKVCAYLLVMELLSVTMAVEYPLAWYEWNVDVYNGTADIRPAGGDCRYRGCQQRQGGRE